MSKLSCSDDNNPYIRFNCLISICRVLGEDNKEKEENNNNNENKGGKKGKKKGKKKFVDVEEDFLADAFKPEENPKPKWKKSSKHN